MAPPTGFEPVTNGLLQWLCPLTASASVSYAEPAALPLSSRPRTRRERRPASSRRQSATAQVPFIKTLLDVFALNVPLKQKMASVRTTLLTQLVRWDSVFDRHARYRGRREDWRLDERKNLLAAGFFDGQAFTQTYAERLSELARAIKNLKRREAYESLLNRSLTACGSRALPVTFGSVEPRGLPTRLKIGWRVARSWRARSSARLLLAEKTERAAGS